MPPVVVDLCRSSSAEPQLPKPARATKKEDGPTAPKPPKLAPLTKTPVYDLSDSSIDIDSFLSTKPAPKPSSASMRPRASLSEITKPIQSMNTSKMTNDFFFLEDDFDSTVDLNDPFGSDPPPAKKRKLSPSSGSKITRSSAYQRWLDKLENSSPADMSMGAPTALGNKSSAVSTIPGATSTMRSVSHITASSRPAALKARAEKSMSDLPRLPSNKMSNSNIGASSKPAAPRTNGGGEMKRSKTMDAVVESDPIIFSSSPNPRADAKKWKNAKARGLTKSVKDILADISDDEAPAPKRSKKDKGRGISTCSGSAKSGPSNVLRDYEFDISSDIDLPDLGALPSQAGSSRAGNGKGKSKIASMTALEKWEAEKAKEKKEIEKEQQKKEKGQKAKDKSVTKEAEKEEKRLAKEEKARGKDRAAELAKLNILMTDKKKSTSEMIVDIPDCLGLRLREQIQTFLKSVEAEHSQYASSLPIIKWRRKIISEFNEQAGHWEAVEPYIGHEKHIMCIMTAQEFVDFAIAEEGKDMESHVLRLKAKFAKNEIIYLIEGLEPWMKKNKTVRNRKYVQEVRNQDPAEQPTASQKRKRKPEPEYVDEDLIEDALLKLQVVHGVLIHHTKVAIETAEWVIVFTQHISTCRYKYVFVAPFTSSQY